MAGSGTEGLGLGGGKVGAIGGKSGIAGTGGGTPAIGGVGDMAAGSFLGVWIERVLTGDNGITGDACAFFANQPEQEKLDGFDFIIIND